MAIKTLGEVAQYINGRAFKPTEWEETGRPIIRIQNLTDTSQVYNRTTKIFEERYLVKDGDLLFAWSASLGAHIWHGEDGWLNQHIFKVLPNKETNKMYLYYYLIHIVDQLYAKTHGSGMVHITLKPFKETPVYLPSLYEQQRIVDRIESLFAKLDEAKEKAQAVVDGFEARKAVILHKAFTGELTKNWCIEYGADRKRWMTKNLGDITINHDSQRIPLSREERSSLAHLFDYYGASGVIDRVDRFIFEGRFLLIGEDGANLVMRSKPIAFIAEGQFWVNNHAHVLDTADEISMDFLCYYINSIDLTSYITGSAQPKMTQAKMNSIPVPVPTIDEQGEIVRILDTLLAKEQQAKETAEAVLDQIEAMKKSILARAFRGELGTNDPTEESAVELLKQVL